jgi:hypothetical protein
VSARLDSLRYNEVATGICSSPRFLDRTDLPADEGAAGSSRALHQGRIRRAPEHLYDAEDVGGGLKGRQISFDPLPEEAHTDGAAGAELEGSRHPHWRRFDVVLAQHAQAAGPRDGTGKLGHRDPAHRGLLKRMAGAHEPGEGRLHGNFPADAVQINGKNILVERL